MTDDFFMFMMEQYDGTKHWKTEAFISPSHITAIFLDFDEAQRCADMVNAGIESGTDIYRKTSTKEVAGIWDELGLEWVGPSLFRGVLNKTLKAGDCWVVSATMKLEAGGK